MNANFSDDLLPPRWIWRFGKGAWKSFPKNAVLARLSSRQGC
jgi:hypothetical protein